MPTNENEHRERFLTYKHYVGAIALEFADGWGGSSSVFKNTFDATRARCGRIDRKAATLSQVYPSLARGWSHLHALWRDTQEEFYEEANAWTPAKAWYAIHHGFSALLPFVGPQDKDRNHQQTCRHLRELIVKRDLLPHPFNLYVTDYGITNTNYERFQRTPSKISTLKEPHNTPFEDYAGVMLRRAADRRSKAIIEAWRKKTGRRRLLKQFRPEIVKKLGGTTLYDVLYGLRTRANYGDVDTFVEGSENLEEAREFAADLVVLTDAALACIEGVLSAYIGAPLYRKAVIKYATDKKIKAATPVGKRLKHVGSQGTSKAG